MTSDSSSRAQQDGDLSTSDLVSRAAAQMSTLIREELALARTELAQKGRRVGIGGGLLGGGGVLALYGLGLLIALAVVALDLVWPLWLGVLVVAVLVFIAAGVAALLGRRQIQAGTPPVPAEAAAGIASDIQTVKDAVQEGRRS